MTGHLTSSSLQGPIWLSGGSVGPEGSLLCFVLIVLLWIVFNRVYPETRYPSPIAPIELPVENQSLGI
jgi:hypothetical protein